MKLTNKKIFYIKEMPAEEEIDLSKAKRVSNAEFGATIRQNKKTVKQKSKKAA